MNKLRWFVERNEVTAKEVKDYADLFVMPVVEAKNMLINPQPPVLQYQTKDGIWLTVPTEFGLSGPWS